MKNRIISILLTIMMVVTLLPVATVTVSAANAGTLSELKNALAKGGTVTLTNNITISEKITISGNVTLDLNGHNLSKSVTDNAFKVEGTLTLKNSSTSASTFSGNTSGDNSLISVEKNGTLILNYGGNGELRLQDNRAGNGGAVYGHSYSTVRIYDNTVIQNCRATSEGGAVWLHDNSTFYMYGGTIDSCEAGKGGAIEITNGTSFTMSGGTISNCKAGDCGGIFVYHSTFTMTGGTLKGNYSTDSSNVKGLASDNSTTTINGGYIDLHGGTGTNATWYNGTSISFTSGRFDLGNTYSPSIGSKSCTINLDKNGGSGGADSISGTYGSSMSKISSLPTLAGYVFDGYYSEPDGGDRFFDENGNNTRNCEYVGSGDNIKLYAHWAVQPCEVTLDKNGGSGGTPSVTAYYGNNMPSISTIPSRTGYTFAGYYNTSNKTGGTKYYNADKTSARTWDQTGTTATLYARWTPNTYTVTLDKNYTTGTGTDGTTSVTATYDADMPTTDVTMPTRTGYTFTGYFDAATNGTKYYNDDGTSAKAWDKTGNTTLYAHWTPNKYTVTLDAQGGAGGTTSVTATYDEEMPTGVTMPTKPGYTHLGYYTSTGDGDQYYNGTAGSVRKWDIPNNTTLYAHWNANQYTIQYWSQDDRSVAEYDAAFVEGVDTDYTDMAYGSFKLPSAAELNLTRTHYDFIGWNEYQDQDWAMYQAGKQYSGGLSKENGGIAQIYAAWKIKPQFNVSYNANGGINPPTSEKVYRDDDYTVSSAVPTREGYTFTGWQADGTAYASGAIIADVQKDITLAAQWQRNNSVGYHPNGGSYAVAPATLYPAKDETVNIDFTNVPTREGYEFKGYAATPGATEATYSASGTTSFTMGEAGVTLYAVWGPETYLINFSGCDDRYAFEGTKPTLVDRDKDYTFSLKIENTYNTDNLSVTANGIAVQPASVVSSDTYKVFTYTVKAAKGEQSVVISGIASTPQKINYELNGGAIEGDYATYYEYGVGADLPASGKVTRTGYTFGGWFADEACEGSAVTAIATTENGEKTFYAKWTANTYTINYNANGGSDAPAGTAAIYDTAVALAEQGSMTYEGYSFLGWDANDNAVAPTYQARDAVKNLSAEAGGTVTLYAIWNVEHHRVTFHINGGVMQDTFALTDSVKHGGSIATPAQTALKKTGNTFQGWAASEGSPVVAYGHNESIIVNGDLDLYAVWEAENYTITYYNGETAVGEPQDMTFGTPAALKDDTGLTAPANKEFLGWSRSTTATAAEFVGGQKVTAIGDGSEKAISLYAVWGDKTAKYLTYNANGGLWTGSVPESVIDYGDGSVTLEAFESARLSRPGYTREGWLVGSTKYEDGATIVITANTTVYANWVANGYTVKFNANGGSGAMANEAMSYDVEAALTANEYTRSGYTFQGWARSAEGPLEFIDGQKVLNLTNVSGAELTLYAVWEAIEPAWITYHANGGAKAPEAVSFAKDTTATVTSAVPELEGYDFVKWNTKADGSGTDYESSAEFTITENITLYAVWQAKVVYHVTYDLAGGSGLVVDPASYYVGGTVTVRSNEPVKSGYDFAGWKLAGGEAVYKTDGTASFTITDSMAAEIVLTAQWTARKYKLNFVFGNAEFTFDGKAKPVQVSASDDDGRVFTDFTVYYEGADYARNTAAPVNAGSYTVTAEFDEALYELKSGTSNTADLTITSAGAVVWATGGTTHLFSDTDKTVTVKSIPELELDVTYYAVAEDGTIGGTVTPDELGEYLYVITLKDNDTNKNYTITNGLSGAPAGKVDELSGSNFGIMTVSDSAQPELVVSDIIVTRTYGDEPFTPVVTGGVEGAEITYSIPNAAELEFAEVHTTSGAITIKKPGTVVVEVKASKTGYSDVTARFAVVIEKRLVNIALEDSVMYTGEVINAPYIVTGDMEDNRVQTEDLVFTYQNLGETAAQGTFRDAGTYYVTAEISDANEYYRSNGSASKNVEITRASLTITADDKTVTYGDAAPTYTFTCEPLGTDTAASLGGSAVYACDYAQNSNAGSYTISLSGLSSDNYVITFADGTLTVEPLAVTVRPADATVSAGNAPVLKLDTSALLASDQTVSGTPVFALTDAEGKTVELFVAFRTEGSYTITWTNPDAVTFSANYDVTKELTATLTVLPASGGTGGGGEGGGIAQPAITVPVSGEDNAIEVKVSVSGNTASVVAPTDKELDSILDKSIDTGVVTIDLTGLDSDISSVVIPTSMMEKIAEAAADETNDVAGLAVKLDTATVEFDVTALKAVVDQAKGEDIQVVIEEVGTARLNGKQLDALKDLDVREGYEAYVISGSARISDFGGGNVSVTIPFVLAEGTVGKDYDVYYVSDDGEFTKLNAAYDSENLCFVVTHFSDYVVVYEGSEYLGCAKDDTCPMSKFTDLDLTAWYHDGVHYCLDNGIMAGKGGGKFAPGGVTTRAQIVTILWNMNGTPYVNYAMTFSDIDEDQWYAEAVRWAAAENIVAGYTDGSFKPDAPITREQLAVILYNYAQYKGLDVSVDENTNFLSFNDFWDTSEWAKPAMMWAVERELIVGSNWDLKPQGDATRAQAATIIWKFCETVAK